MEYERLIPSGISVAGMLLIIGTAWGRLKQILNQVKGKQDETNKRVMKVEKLAGNTNEAAVTHEQCRNLQSQCSLIVCEKLDDIKASMVAMEKRREKDQKEIYGMKVHIAKIAQFIEDKNGKIVPNGNGDKSWIQK